MSCNGNFRGEVHSVQEHIARKEASYLIPTYINNVEIWALRDSGNQGGVLIDESLVDQSQIIPGKTVKLKGIFDS